MHVVTTLVWANNKENKNSFARARTPYRTLVRYTIRKPQSHDMFSRMPREVR